MTDIEVADRLAIVELTNRYCWALDEHNWDDLVNVFTPNPTAVLLTDGTLEGVDEIIARVRAALEHLDGTQHMVTNHRIAVDSDKATCNCYLQAQHFRGHPDGNNFMVAGRYDDRLVRTDEGWRISHRELTTMWTDGNLAVVTPD